MNGLIYYGFFTFKSIFTFTCYLFMTCKFFKFLITFIHKVKYIRSQSNKVGNNCSICSINKIEDFENMHVD